MKDLTEEERDLISIQCTSFFLTIHKANVYKPSHKSLLSLFGNKYSKELWVILTAVGAVIRNKSLGVQIPLNESKYTTANKITNLKISFTRTRDLLFLLDDSGWITLYKGTKTCVDRRTGELVHGTRTCVIPSQKLLTLMGTKKVNYSLSKDSKNYIEVRDDKKYVIDSSKFNGIRKLRDEVTAFNTLLSNHVISLGNIVCPVAYKRIFSVDLTGGGRWYAMSSFQTIKSERRKELLIDGEPTTEVDYKSIHPSILYTLEGINKGYNFDPYCLPKSTLKTSPSATDKGIRTFIKLAMLIIMYSGDEKKAVKALTRKISQGLFPNIDMSAKGSYLRLINALCERNKEISHYFKDELLWKKLQHYDSVLAGYVISKFVSEDKPIYPYHDSFVVKLVDKEYLIQCMREAWVHSFDTGINFRYDVEF